MECRRGIMREVGGWRCGIHELCVLLHDRRGSGEGFPHVVTPLIVHIECGSDSGKLAVSGISHSAQRHPINHSGHDSLTLFGVHSP